MRFYQRQIDTRAHEAAEIMGWSASYLSDNFERQTGRASREVIRSFLVDKAKSCLHTPTKSVKEVTVELGFDCPNHFARFLKNRTGETPSQFRKQVHRAQQLVTHDFCPIIQSVPTQASLASSLVALTSSNPAFLNIWIHSCSEKSRMRLMPHFSGQLCETVFSL